MKIKLDHVTNSSSTGFIISIPIAEQESFEQYMANLNDHDDAQNEGVSIYMSAESKEELDEYTNDGPLDWAQKPTGPRFECLNEGRYKLCKEVIEDGGIAIECWVDNNICEKFEEDNKGTIIESYC